MPGVAMASLAIGTYFTHSRSAAVLAAASTSIDSVDESSLVVARNLAAQAHGTDEQALATEAVRIADHAVRQAFDAALRKAADSAPPLSAEAVAASQKIAALEENVEEEKEHVAAINAARLKTASQNDVAQLGERAQEKLDLDTDRLNELHRSLNLMGGGEQARIQQQVDQYDSLREQPIVTLAAGNDLESPQGLGTLPGKIRAWIEIRAREKELRKASHDAASTSEEQQKNAATEYNGGIQDQRQLASIYASWAEIAKAKRVAVQHAVLLAAAILIVIFLAVPFGVVLIRRELGAKIAGTGRRYPLIAGLAVETLALALVLVVIFGEPFKMPGALGL